MVRKDLPVCYGCTRFQGVNDDQRGVCSSFPDGIPEDIWRGNDPHIRPRGDEAIYEPKDVAQLALFVGRFVLPALNPTLAARWQTITRALLRRAGETSR